MRAERRGVGLQTDLFTKWQVKVYPHYSPNLSRVNSCFLTRDRVFEADETPEDGCQVTDDGSQDSDHSERDEEAEPAASHTRGGNQGEYNLKMMRLLKI